MRAAEATGSGPSPPVSQWSNGIIRSGCCAVLPLQSNAFLAILSALFFGSLALLHKRASGENQLVNRVTLLPCLPFPAAAAAAKSVQHIMLLSFGTLLTNSALFLAPPQFPAPVDVDREKQRSTHTHTYTEQRASRVSTHLRFPPSTPQPMAGPLASFAQLASTSLPLIAFPALPPRAISSAQQIAAGRPLGLGPLQRRRHMPFPLSSCQFPCSIARC